MTDPESLRARLTALVAEMRESPDNDVQWNVASKYWADRLAALLREPPDYRQGCICSCCDHGEGSDCACACHENGLCAFQMTARAAAPEE